MTPAEFDVTGKSVTPVIVDIRKLDGGLSL